MIDHKVLIGDDDVSNEVVSIKVQDQVDTDADPGKITIVLANRLKKDYSTLWAPQKTPIEVVIYNWCYDTEEERRLAGGHAEAEYLVAYGHMTACSRNASEITINAECDLGHLSDAIGGENGDDYNSSSLVIWASEVLKEVLAMHKDLQFKLHYQARDIQYRDGKSYNSETTYQEVLEDIRNDVGAVYYFSEEGVLEFRDPAAIKDVYELDPYVINPDDTSSIIGFRNVVNVIGSETLAESEAGTENPSSNPIQATARDDEAGNNRRARAKANKLATNAKAGLQSAIDDLGLERMFTQEQLDKAIEDYVKANGGPGSVEELGELVAPTDRAIYLKTQEDCQKRADLLLNFYKLFKNALTKPKVAGIIPPLHSRVSYSVFIPISSDEASAGTIAGIVVARSIEYSIDGIECDLTISPGAEDMETYVGDEVIEEFTESFGQED